MSSIVQCLRIEGVGDATGQYVFTSTTFNSHDARFKAWTPVGSSAALSQSEVSPIGGVRTQEELRFELVDVGDTLTDFLASEGPVITRLPYYEAAGATSIEFDDDSDFSAGDVVCVGREAIRLEYNTTGNQWAVTRGWLGTTARNLPARSPVRRRVALAAGRRCTLTLAVDGVEGTPETFILDAPQLDSTLNTWSFSGRSLERVLDKQTFTPRKATITWVSGDTFNTTDSSWWPHYGERTYLKVNSEIIRCRKHADNASFVVEARGVCGTERKDFDVGDEVEEVFIADENEPDEYRSFRWSPTSTYPQNFTPTSHPVPIMLAIATSGDPTQGYTNGRAGLGYFACLPYGLGIDANDIDDSWLEVWERLPRASLPRFSLEAEPVRDLFERIARYCGLFVFWQGGKLCCACTAVETPTDEVAVSDLVVGDRVPRLGTPTYSNDWLTSAVHIEGSDSTSDFSRADFGAEFGFDEDLNDGSEYSQTLEAPWLALREVEPEFARQRALSLLKGFSRPLWVVEVTVPTEWRDRLRFGQIVRWSSSQMPDFESGQRGTAPQYWRVLGRQIDLEGCTVTFRLLSRGAVYPESLIAPSASISGIASNVYSCVANRYTDADNTLGLPMTDVDAFEEGDVVQVQDRTGTIVVTSPTYATISSIGTNSITLSSALSGASTGDVIVYVTSTAATARQLQNAVYLDQAQRLFGGE